jgi:malate dehydrogenase (oxaloacetate-decarboxylating)(NADP+)
LIVSSREDLNPYKAVFAQDLPAATLPDVMSGSDVFIGLSGPNLLTEEMVLSMNDRPIIFAMANPDPEILPTKALAIRDDIIIATGRSDFPNQVNNVLCFPYIFRGALDVGATTINEQMKIAAVKAIAQLAREAPSEVVAQAYDGSAPLFGEHSLIPSPFDPRLIMRIAPAVARMAMETGVARKPIADFKVYEDSLSRFVFRSGFIMKPGSLNAQSSRENAGTSK